jgi:phosphate transport system permease protein
VAAVRIAINNLAGVPSIVYGAFGLGFFCYGLGAGIDEVFFKASLVADGQPVFGTGGLLWASLTLALLTLPVVIVATEEALSAVPNSMREGSYACGAGKWQTIRRIVLPRALPGIMTGIILSLSRAIGESAPLITIGAVTYISSIPEGVNDRFTVLPIQIFDWSSRPQKGFQDAAAGAIVVLLAILLVMNSLAIILRARARR